MFEIEETKTVYIFKKKSEIANDSLFKMARVRQRAVHILTKFILFQSNPICKSFDMKQSE